MNKDEIIKDIQRTLIGCCNYIDENNRLNGNKCSNCEYWEHTNNLCASYEKKQAIALYNAGYRKVGEDEIVESMKTYERAREETAREILQEIKQKYGIELE